jgi:hypothetical protein
MGLQGQHDRLPRGHAMIVEKGQLPVAVLFCYGPCRYCSYQKTKQMQQIKKHVGTKLNQKEMKKVQGGGILPSVWTCWIDGYTCFNTKDECLLGCSSARACRVTSWCP